MRVSVPAQNLEVVRDDVSSVAVRHVVVSRPGRCGDQDPRQRHSDSRHDLHTAATGREDYCPRSSSSADLSLPIGTKPCTAFRFSANWPAPWPTPASSSCATTGAELDRAAAERRRRRLMISPRICSPWSKRCGASRTSIESASRSSATAMAVRWRRWPPRGRRTSPRWCSSRPWARPAPN